MQNGSRHKSSEAAQVGNAQSVFRSVDTRHQGRFWKTYLVGLSPIPKTIFQSPRVHHPTKGLECLASPTKFERDELAMPLARINPHMNNPENLHTNLDASESSVCPPNARLFDGKMMFQTMKFAGGSLKTVKATSHIEQLQSHHLLQRSNGFLPRSLDAGTFQHHWTIMPWFSTCWYSNIGTQA